MAARFPAGLAVAFTFVLVNLGWAFFCMDMPRVWVAFSRMARLA